jgi:hypothetical protein
MTRRQPDPQLWEQWHYKPGRGYGSFTVVAVRGARVTLRSKLFGKDKTISVATLRSDYERVKSS